MKMNIRIILLVFLIASTTLISFGLKSQNDKIIALLNSMKMSEKVIVTAYHPKSRGINSDKDPTKIAIMEKPKVGYTAAISTELFELGWLNRIIYVDGYGIRRASDRMKTSVKGKRIDLCVGSKIIANKIGINNNILAVVLD